MSPVAWAVTLVAVQRLAELVVSSRNTRRLLAAGGIEYGAGHYPFLVAFHVAWLATLVLLVPSSEEVRWWAAASYLALQPLRLWVIVSLGNRWTTRVIVLRGARLVRSGLYRWLRHPNYAIVAAEIALLPLAFGAWTIALLFTVVHVFLLAWRIRVENAALHASEAPNRHGHANVYGVRARFGDES